MGYNEPLLKGNLMFKNRKLEIKLVKDGDKPTITNTVVNVPSKEDISEITKDLLTKAVIATIVVVGSVVAINTLASVSLLTLNNRLNTD